MIFTGLSALITPHATFSSGLYHVRSIFSPREHINFHAHQRLLSLVRVQSESSFPVTCNLTRVATSRISSNKSITFVYLCPQSLGIADTLIGTQRKVRVCRATPSVSSWV